MKRRLPAWHWRALLSICVSALLYAAALVASLFDTDHIPEWIRGAGVVGLVATSIATQYTQSYVPLRRKHRQYATKVLDVIVEGFCRQYDTIRGGGSELLRLNVMLPDGTKRHWLIGGRPLGIQYHRGEYTEGELQLRYHHDEGACGRSFAKNTILLYDRGETQAEIDQQLELFNMPPIHRDVTNNVKVCISIPIYLPHDEEKRRPIGILNIDSVEADLEQTGLDEATIRNLAIDTAVLIGIVYE